MRILALSVLLSMGAVDAFAQPRPPNIVLVLADDLGYGDVGAFNAASRIPTPHMDRLARAHVLAKELDLEHELEKSGEVHS